MEPEELARGDAQEMGLEWIGRVRGITRRNGVGSGVIGVVNHCAGTELEGWGRVERGSCRGWIPAS